MNKIAVGMICDSYSYSSGILKKIKSISQLYFDSVQYYYNCIGFRVVDLDTLEIEDYSVKEALELAGGVRGINPFDERDFVNGKLPLCRYGYTERYMAENFIDSNGQFDPPSVIGDLPVILSERPSLSLISRYKKNKEINKQIVDIGNRIPICNVYVDIIKKGIKIELHRNFVYSCGCFRRIRSYHSDLNYGVILVEDAELSGLYDKFGCDAVAGFGDNLVVNFNRKGLLSDMIIPNTFKKVILDGSNLSEYSANKGKSYSVVIPPNTFKKVILDGSNLSEYSANKGKSYSVVIPPSVNNIVIKNKSLYENVYGKVVYSDKSTLENIKLTLHIPSKHKDLIYEIYRQLSDNIIGSSLKIIRSKFTEDGYKDIVNFILDECKVEIELY